MPAQKRSYDDAAASSPPDDNSVEQDHDENEDKEKEDSDGSSSSSSSFSSSGVSEKEEFVIVKMGDLRKEVQCPICLGIIRKTRTVMECLHRFCRECIDKSMRLGNKECPACRAHCASRRSLRDDPNFDTLIAVLLPDIEKYEEEESAFHEEENARNKQIQASIAQTSRRQLEALGRKRTARATAAAFERRSQSSYRNLRGRNQKTAEIQDSDNEDDANGHDGGKDSSSADEHSTEVKPKRKRWRGACYSQASLAANSADGVCDDNELEVTREYTGISAALVGGSEMLAWGRGGMRSHTRHGSLTGSNGKNARNARIYKLVNHLQSLPKLEDQLDIHLMLVSLDEQKILSLQEPYIRCRPTWSIRHLCQLVALDTAVQADEVEMLLVKEDLSKLIASQSVPGPIVIDPSKDELHLVEEHETLMDLQAKHNCISHELILAYRRKMSG